MADFQDECGLGELPPDLSLQERSSYILPSNPSQDIQQSQPQTGVQGLDVPRPKSDVQFIYDSRPLFCEDLIYREFLTALDGTATFSYTPDAGKLVVIDEFEYIAVDAGGMPTQAHLDIFINGTEYKNYVTNSTYIAGNATGAPQDKRKCFIVVEPGQTISFVLSVGNNNYVVSFGMRGNIMVSNGNPAYLQVAGG